MFFFLRVQGILLNTNFFFNVTQYTPLCQALKKFQTLPSNMHEAVFSLNICKFSKNNMAIISYSASTGLH